MYCKSDRFVWVKVVSIVIALLLSICGCSYDLNTDETEQSVASKSESELFSGEYDESNEISEENSSTEADKTENLALTASVPDEFKVLFDDTADCLQSSNGKIEFTLKWDEPVDIDRIVSSEAGETIDALVITAKDADGNIINRYTQDECGKDRVSAIMQKNVSCLEFVYSAEIDFELIKIDILGSKPEHGDFNVSAYLPANVDFIQQSDSEIWNQITDMIIISGSSWDENGSINVKGNFKDQCANVAENVKIWATIYPSVMAGESGETINTVEKRDILIDNIIAFAEEYDLDGIDFDWEFPADETVWEHFSLLIAELKERQESLLLSAAFYPGKAMLTDKGFAALDRVNVMAYDQFDEKGRHSNYKIITEITDDIGYFTENSCEVNKLYIGIPAYGRPNDASKVWNLYKDLGVSDKYTNQYNGCYFNSCAIAADKTAYALQNGFGGVFIYHIAADKSYENEFSILKSIMDYLRF